MKSLLPQYSQHLHTLFGHLQETEDQESDPITRTGICIKLCMDSLQQLRRSIMEQGFPDRAAEIHFFKYIKPVIVGRYTFYRRIHQLHLGELKGWKQEKERLARELDAASRFFEQHTSFWCYYRSGSQVLDEQYFLRGNDDWQLHPLHTGFDDLFSTGGDEQLAELLSMELFMEYIDRRLEQQGDPASGPKRHPTAPALRCTASVSELVELGYALYVIGFFQSAKTIKETMEQMSATFGVELSRYYDVFVNIKERKINVTRFLDKLKHALEMHIRSTSRDM